MGKRNPKAYKRVALALLSLVLSSCISKVQIEPSDKPFVVNLNVKIDHDIRVKIEDQNKDLLNLEEQVMKQKKSG